MPYLGLATFFWDLSQSEKPSEIKPPLAVPETICVNEWIDQKTQIPVLGLWGKGVFTRWTNWWPLDGHLCSVDGILLLTYVKWFFVSHGEPISKVQLRRTQIQTQLPEKVSHLLEFGYAVTALNFRHLIRKWNQRILKSTKRLKLRIRLSYSFNCIFRSN